MREAVELGLVRTALVTAAENAVGQMQTRRLTAAAGFNARFFTDAREARAWLADSEIFARRSGDERMGFVVHSNRYSRLFRMELWGLWDVQTANALRAEMLRTFDEMKGEPWVILADGSRYPPQKGEVAAIHQDSMSVSTQRGVARIAMMVDSALNKLQVRRLFEEGGSPPNVRFFTDEKEARDWLAEIDARTRWSS